MIKPKIQKAIRNRKKQPNLGTGMILLVTAFASTLFASIEVDGPAFFGHSDLYALAVVRPKAEVTDIYRIREESFVRTHRFNWVSDDVYVREVRGILCVIKVDVFHKGVKPTREHDCLEFFVDGRSVSKLSTYDILGGDEGALIMPLVGDEDRYKVISKIVGFVSLGGGANLFQIETTLGNTVLFDILSGAIISPE